MKEFCYLNGDILPIEKAHLHITDLAILRGYGVFDFFRAIDGKPLYLEDHLTRFQNSAAMLHLPTPSREHLREHILKIIKLNQQPLLGVKLVLTGGYSPDGYEIGEPNLFMLAKPFTFKSADCGVKLMTVNHLREMPEAKTINYLVPISTLPQQRAMGADDVLYHQNGYILESSRSNVFIIKNEKIITPKTNILHGITRKYILEVATTAFEVEERPVSLAELWAADEVFISASTRRIHNVQKIDNQVFEQNKITFHLADLLQKYEQKI